MLGYHLDRFQTSSLWPSLLSHRQVCFRFAPGLLFSKFLRLRIEQDSSLWLQGSSVFRKFWIFLANKCSPYVWVTFDVICCVLNEFNMVQMAHLKNLWKDAKVNWAFYLEVKCPFCTSRIAQGFRVWLNTMALLALAGRCHTVAYHLAEKCTRWNFFLSPRTAIIVAILPVGVLGILKGWHFCIFSLAACAITTHKWRDFRSHASVGMVPLRWIGSYNGRLYVDL